MRESAYNPKDHDVLVESHADSSLEVPLVCTRDHEQDRVRRGALNRFFSKARMMQIEPEIRRLVSELCDKMLRTREPLYLSVAYSCFTSDVTSQYAYGEPLGFLAHHNWDKNYKDAMDGFMGVMYLFRFFP
ncbi:hypothetical protein PG988_008041 [Apiospora saccharicola]